jgi:hypothetical protein
MSSVSLLPQSPVGALTPTGHPGHDDHLLVVPHNVDHPVVANAQAVSAQRLSGMPKARGGDLGKRDGGCILSACPRISALHRAVRQPAPWTV